MTGPLVAIGPCFGCGKTFSFDPDAVPSVPIDPANNLPPDLGGDPGRAISRPVCPTCVAIVNRYRARRGLPAWPDDGADV